jgi:hypothetical protein
MHPRLLSAHLSRRSALIATAASTVVALGGASACTAQTQQPDTTGQPSTTGQSDAMGQEADFDDSPIDPGFVQAGGWGASPYGPEDERGTLNEVTAAAWRRRCPDLQPL